MHNPKLWRIVVGFGAAACILVAGVLLIFVWGLAEEYGWCGALRFYLRVVNTAWIAPVLIVAGYFVLTGLIYGVVREASVRGLLVTALLTAVIASVALQVYIGQLTLAYGILAMLLRAVVFAPVMVATNLTFAMIAGLPWRAPRTGWSA